MNNSFTEDAAHIITQLQALSDIVFIIAFIVGVLLLISAVAMIPAATQGMRSQSAMGRQINPGMALGTAFAGAFLIALPAFIQFNVFVLTSDGITENTNPFSYTTPDGQSGEDLFRLAIVTLFQTIGLVVMAIAAFNIRDIANPSPHGEKKTPGQIIMQLLIGALLMIPTQALEFVAEFLPFFKPVADILGGNSGSGI